MNLQPGMIVKLKDRRGFNWNSGGDMDRYKGREVKILTVTNNGFYIQQDGDDYKTNWIFSLDDVESIISESFDNLLIFN